MSHTSAGRPEANSVRHRLLATRFGLRAMRAVVILLAVLAALKVGHQEYLFRSATRDVIINAYRDRAVVACQRDGKSAHYGLPPQAWAHPAEIKLVIGKGNLDVYLWQVDHELWNARFRNPYLFLIAQSRSGSVFCEYDILNGVASVHPM
jgi:hypothetical protein